MAIKFGRPIEARTRFTPIEAEPAADAARSSTYRAGRAATAAQNGLGALSANRAHHRRSYRAAVSHLTRRGAPRSDLCPVSSGCP